DFAPPTDDVPGLKFLLRRRGESERSWCANNSLFPPRENWATSAALRACGGRASDLFPAACKRRFHRGSIHLLLFVPSVGAQFPSNPAVATQGLVPADSSEFGLCLKVT